MLVLMTPTLVEVTALLAQHVILLNEVDEAKRTLALPAVYAENLQFLDPHGEFTGRAYLNNFVHNLQLKYPGFVFRETAPLEFHHNVARLSWAFGPVGGTAPVTGQDIAVLANGRIQTLYIFIDGATAPVNP
jgi:hypothetical protein